MIRHAGRGMIFSTKRFQGANSVEAGFILLSQAYNRMKKFWTIANLSSHPPVHRGMIEWERKRRENFGRQFPRNLILNHNCCKDISHFWSNRLYLTFTSRKGFHTIFWATEATSRLLWQTSSEDKTQLKRQPLPNEITHQKVFVNLLLSAHDCSRQNRNHRCGLTFVHRTLSLSVSREKFLNNNNSSVKKEKRYVPRMKNRSIFSRYLLIPRRFSFQR